jgi:hypothetical protein
MTLRALWAVGAGYFIDYKTSGAGLLSCIIIPYLKAQHLYEVFKILIMGKIERNLTKNRTFLKI